LVVTSELHTSRLFNFFLLIYNTVQKFWVSIIFENNFIQHRIIKLFKSESFSLLQNVVLLNLLFIKKKSWENVSRFPQKY